MSMLAFFPWLKLKDTITVENYTLVPYRRNSAPTGQSTDLQGILDAVTEAYKMQPDAPIDQATIIQVDQGNLIRDLNGEERGSIFVFSELLALAGLSCRIFFNSWYYWNRDSFRVIIQSFQIPYEGSAIQSRRRDGSTTNYEPKESLHIQKPEHVSLNANIQVDQPLLQALLKAEDSEIWGRISESIVNFNLANTDNMEMAEQIEGVLLIGALDNTLANYAALILPNLAISVEMC